MVSTCFYPMAEMFPVKLPVPFSGVNIRPATNGLHPVDQYESENVEKPVEPTGIPLLNHG